MQKDILFYQANFEPELNRLLQAEKSGDLKFILLFKNKTLKIVDEILKLSNNFAEKEEWFSIRNIVADIEHTDENVKKIISNYGIPFSNKYAYRLSMQ